MEQDSISSRDPGAILPPVPFTPSADLDPQPKPEPRARIGELEGHLPEIVEPLVPADPENAFTETRYFRHDGWTPARKRLFLEQIAESGVVTAACEAVGMSARAAYNLRDRDPLFAAGWEAACAMARPRLADEAYSRSMNGVVERIYKDGIVVAERHRYDNRLTMAVLARLDARIDRAEERGAPHLALVERWDEYLAALGEDRRDDGLAMLAPPEPAPDPASESAGRENAGDRELRELSHREGAEAEEGEEDRHAVWQEEDDWWTDYPPPPDYDGDEQGEYGERDYRRTLSEAEQEVMEADEAEEQRLAEEKRGRAEAQRDAYFGLATLRPGDGEAECDAEAQQDAPSDPSLRPRAPPEGA